MNCKFIEKRWETAFHPQRIFQAQDSSVSFILPITSIGQRKATSFLSRPIMLLDLTFIQSSKATVCGSSRSCGESLQRVSESLWCSNHSSLVLTDYCHDMGETGFLVCSDIVFDSEFAPRVHLWCADTQTVESWLRASLWGVANRVPRHLTNKKKAVAEWMQLGVCSDASALPWCPCMQCFTIARAKKYAAYTSESVNIILNACGTSCQKPESRVIAFFKDLRGCCKLL